MRGLITSYLRVGRGQRLARRAAGCACRRWCIWGDRDRLVDPALAPRLAAAVPDARLLVLEGVGHVAMLEAPEQTARAVLGMVEAATHPSCGRPWTAGGNVPVTPGCCLARHGA